MTLKPITPTQSQITAKKFSMITEGYAYIDKTVGHTKGNSANVYVPRDWKDKKVRIILLE